MGRTLTYYSYNSRVGAVTIAASSSGIASISFGTAQLADARFEPCALTNEAATQIQEYFAGKRCDLDVPLDAAGSAFAQTVWAAIRQIPYGMTATAGQIAERIGKPESLRAVGNAISSAPAELLIPVHRVIGANGRVRGTGQSARRHQSLLEFEQAQLAKRTS